MQVESVRFGTLSVDDDKIILFPKGIPGFEDVRRFFLLDHAGSPRIKWLHSVDDPSLALVVANPFDLFPDYRPDLPDEAARDLGIAAPDRALMLTVLTVKAGRREGEPPMITANLLAPIIISQDHRVGAQVLLKSGDYNVRQQVVVGIGRRAKVAPGGGGSASASNASASGDRGGHSGLSCRGAQASVV